MEVLLGNSSKNAELSLAPWLRVSKLLANVSRQSAQVNRPIENADFP